MVHACARDPSDWLQLPSLQVKLNRGLDFVQLDDLLIDLKLTPDVLEVPVPCCFIEDRQQVGCLG